MTSVQLLQELIDKTEANRSFIKKSVIHMSSNQLNWQKNNQSWSINHVLGHLNEYAKYYHTEFKRKIEHTRFTEPLDSFVSSPLGKSAWRAMKLGNAQNIKRSFKSPKLYNPLINTSIATTDPSDEFIANQTVLIDLLNAARNVNLKKVKIPISISKIVRLRLGDALQFVIYHNERHMQQIKRIIEQPDFPKQ
jgi:hypothetical protein